MSTPVSNPAESARSGSSDDPPVETVAERKQTLPPPEWSAPRSVSGLALEWLSQSKPVERRRGSKAEMATLRAGLAAARRSGDLDEEARITTELARRLAASGGELDLATKLGRRALMLRDNPRLREELASWFAGLGEPGLAAATLRPLLDSEEGETLARVLTRVAVFLGRKGDAGGAAAALARASLVSTRDPLPSELRGAIAAWSPEAVSSHEAAQAYLEAARRRDVQGDKAGAFEDLLRAFEMAPGSALAAERLASNLASRGRTGAADEVVRESARNTGDRARALHFDRMRDAVRDGDLARALGAALDARAQTSMDLDALVMAVDLALGSRREIVASFDAVLARLRCYDVLAARLELCAERVKGRERARGLLALGHLAASALASAERAADAWIAALAADPENEAVKVALRELAASTGDYMPFVEALVRVGTTTDRASAPARAACLRELWVLADQRLSDPSLALWAFRRLVTESESHAEDVEGSIERLEARARLQDRNLSDLRDRLRDATGPERPEALRMAAAALRGRPDDVGELVAVLRELVGLAPDERGWRHALERALERMGQFAGLEALWHDDLERSPSRAVAERARLGLASARRRAGDPEGALTELEPFADDSGHSRAGQAMLLCAAAQSGARALEARALLRIAEAFSPAGQAVVSSVAAELFVLAGASDEALRAAERACHADSSLPRPVWTLASVVSGRRDRIAAVALERAMGVVVPRARLCRELAETHDALGEPAPALAWTQRWLALRPGDPEAASALLDRVTAHGEPGRIADALAWLFSQPQPLNYLAPKLESALCRLADLDPARGGALARRALDVFGPRLDEVRDALLAVADSVGEPSIAIAVIERQLAAGAPGPDRAGLIVDLARRRRHAGDADGAARALVRALDEGADPAAVLAELDVALPPRGSDGEISQLVARAEALSALTSADLGATARAWREYGAALWDLAGDVEGAVEAWERAAALDPEHGLVHLARDLVTFAGHREAVRRLEELASRRGERADRAAVLASAAGVALDGRSTAEALRIAVLALDEDASRADVLAIVEQAAGPGDIDALEHVYQRIIDATLGMYGERAGHYRAARQLERRGERRRAMRHAIAAFEAVPAEGVTFVLMTRLAERTGESSEAVEAIERVADKSDNAEQRSVWLRRAALVAASDEDGKRQRVDVLLRALDANPEGETLRSLGSALADLVRIAPDDREIAELRYARALKAMLPRLAGPEGARIAVEAAGVALETFGQAELALQALGRAIRADASIDEYDALVESSGRLALAGEAARELLREIADQLETPHTVAGAALIRLALGLAEGVDDRPLRARVMVDAAARDPEDDDLLQQAEQAARAANDPVLLARLDEAVPPAQRADKLIEAARRAERNGALDAAAEALERARALPGAPDDRRARAVASLRELHRRRGRLDALEAVIRDELDQATADEEVVSLARELAALQAEQGRFGDCREVLLVALERDSENRALLNDFLRHARQADDTAWQIDALSRIAEVTTAAPERADLLRRLGPLLAAEGDAAGAVARYRELLEVDPRDAMALAALERDAEEREDWTELSDLMARRAGVARTKDEARTIRVGLARLLESRLGRLQDARTELERLLSEIGDHLDVLEMLADLNERLGARLRAAPLWLRASAIPKDRAKAGEYARRACLAYLEGGDVDSARRVLEEMKQYPRSADLVALRVEIERRSENPKGLSEALEEMALLSMDPPEARASMLLEAARAALAHGDLPTALGQAQRAARIARESAQPQLFARSLEYRERGGPGGAAEAKATLLELSSAQGQLDPKDRELRVFLAAEALDVCEGAGEGMRELSHAHAELGPLPLIALGMAERLAAGDEPARALPLFDQALDGDLRGLRRRGDVALRAAEAAELADDPDRALEYLELAASMPESRAEALRRQADVRISLGRISEAPHFADEAQKRHSDPAPRPVASRGPPPGTPPPGSLRAQAPPKPAARRSSGTLPAVTDPRPAREHPPEQGPESERARSLPPPDVVVRDEAARVASSMPPPFPPATDTEQTLLRALSHGSIEAGKELIQQLENRSDRTQDLVNVCRRVSLLLPGDLWVLERLFAATTADRNISYARAVEHVLRAFEPGAAPLEPPPLADQIEQPDRACAMLFRETTGAANEALGLVWSGAQHIFRRDPSSYGVTGLERVSPTAPNALARLYGAASRLLGTTRTPVFQRKSGEPVTINVALLSPAALIVNGEVRSTSPVLAYHLGAMLAATFPEHVLLFGSPESQAKNVLRALLAAFGPPQAGRRHLASVATLAEMLWESIPARDQRRLRELCDAPEAIDYEIAFVSARQAVRRAGLFVSGDLTTAVREACADLGVSARGLDGPGGLAALCASSPAIADLVRLATSPEYADARWQPARPGGRPPSGTWGRVSTLPPQ